MPFFCSTISSVVYLRCRMRIQAKPMNRKRFWSSLLSDGGRNCSKLSLTFSYSKRGLATFASDKRGKRMMFYDTTSCKKRGLNVFKACFREKTSTFAEKLG